MLRITEGRGVDVVYDSTAAHHCAASARWPGAPLLPGGASGLVESIVPLELGEAGSVFFTRPHLADYIATPAELAGRAGELFDHALRGRLQVTIDRRWPLAETADAMRYLEAGRTRGKLLLDIPGA
jgi:NADPH2:quinone reductase